MHGRVESKVRQRRRTNKLNQSESYSFGALRQLRTKHPLEAVGPKPAEQKRENEIQTCKEYVNSANVWNVQTGSNWMSRRVRWWEQSAPLTAKSALRIPEPYSSYSNPLLPKQTSMLLQAASEIDRNFLRITNDSDPSVTCKMSLCRKR